MRPGSLLADAHGAGRYSGIWVQADALMLTIIGGAGIWAGGSAS